jgi:fermentation-respiration switch protein FrsA (DUF1100 family)
VTAARHPVRNIAVIAALAVAVYAGLCAFVYAAQSEFVYHPHAHLAATPAAVGLAYQNVEIPTGNGLRLHGWFVPDAAARGTVLFFHGNGGNISHYLSSLPILHRLRLNVLIFDYRGYGGNPGTPSEQGTYRDAMAAWRYLTRTRGIAPRRLVLLGRSLGGAVAAYLAERVHPAALILESTFRSIPSMIHVRAPWLPAHLVARYHYNTLARMRHIHCPVLVAHSPDDEVVPYAAGRALFAAANPPKVFLKLRGRHDTGFLTSGNIYRQGLNQFLTKYLGT